MSYKISGLGAFDAMQPNCGDTGWLQTSLKSQGYDPGPLDKIWGQQTAAAFARYCVEKVGVGAIQAGQCCNTLQQAMAGAVPGGGGGGTPQACPQGTIQSPLPPYTCVQIPGAQQQQGGGGAQAQSCPPGTTGIYPLCFTLPGMPGGGGGQQPMVQSTSAGLTMGQKAAIGAVAVLGIGALFFFSKKKRSAPALAAATPNKSQTWDGDSDWYRALRKSAKKRRRGWYQRKYGKGTKERTGSRRRRARKNFRRYRGGVIGLKSGKRFGHRVPPKKYRRMGAVRRSQYAWPAGYAYPVHDRKHAKVALGRFGRYKKRYPMSVRRTIAKRLNQAKKRFGIGGPPVQPNRRR